MSNDAQSSKSKIREAQARHQSALFAGEPVQSAPSQRAEAQIRDRGASLSAAAKAKQQALSPDEAKKLAELKQRNEQARPTAAQPQAQPAPKTKTPATKLHELSKRNDLAAQALANMKEHLKKSPQATGDRQQSASPIPQPAQQAQPAQPPRPQPASPDGQARPARKAPPTPEELDALLKQLSRRPRPGARPGARPAPGGLPPRPGAFGPEGAPEQAAAVETPPPPPEVFAKEEQNVEKQAEILKELQAKESQAKQDIRPIPQADQERAQEKSVEATVPIRTEGNAVSSAPLHQAVANLQVAMRAHDATGQVAGVTAVQRTMPHHPLYSPKTTPAPQQLPKEPQ